MWSDGVNLVDEIGTAVHSDGSNSLLDDRVVGDGNALLVKLAKSPLVDELLDGRSGGVPVGDIRLDETKHTNGRLVELDECRIVNLAKTE